MKVAIIGAGMAGLGAARALRDGGVQATVFEKSRGAGGRVNSRSQDGFTWDTGATGIAPGDGPLAEAMRLTGVVEIDRPVWLHRDLVPEPGDRKLARYAHPGGFRAMTAALAEGLDLRAGVEIDGLTREGAGYIVAGGRFDAVVLTPPIPQTARLLWSLGESRPLATTRYRSCLTVLLGYDVSAPETPYHALLDGERSHPLGWIAIETAKVTGRAPEGSSAFTLQLSAAYSLAHYGDSDEASIRATLPWMTTLFGEDFATPVASSVFRWKYSQPDTTADFDAVNPEGVTLLVAGDGVAGPRAEKAYASGVRVAERLLG